MHLSRSWPTTFQTRQPKSSVHLLNIQMVCIIYIHTTDIFLDKTFHDWYILLFLCAGEFWMMSHEPEDDEGEARKGEWKYLTLQNILWISFLSWHWSVVKYHLSTRSFLFATRMPQQFVVISCLEPCFLPNSKFPSGTRFLPSKIINSATPSQSGKGDRYKMVDELFEVVKILHLYVNS